MFLFFILNLSTVSNLYSSTAETGTNDILSQGISQPLPKKRRATTQFDTLIETMTSISNKKIDTFVKGVEDNVSPELRHFFLSLASTVDKFDNYNQALAKKRIMDIVTDMEFGRIQQQYNNSSNWSSINNSVYPTNSNNTHTNVENHTSTLPNTMEQPLYNNPMWSSTNQIL